MTIEFLVFQVVAKWQLVLFLITGDGVRCTNSARAVPDHIFGPALFQYFRGATHGSTVIQGAQVCHHLVHQGKCCHTLFFWRIVKQQSIVISWARVNKRCSRLRWQWVNTSLLHHTDNVDEQTGFSNFAIFNTVELGITQVDHLASCTYAHPVSVEQAHKVAHAHHPLLTADFIGTTDENILTTLHTA